MPDEAEDFPGGAVGFCLFLAVAVAFGVVAAVLGWVGRLARRQ
jgi:hypothetical protein